MRSGIRIGHYEVLSVIGKGGMGQVWLGQDTNLRREVAIKFVNSQLAANLNAVERLRVEARAASGINHPNICTVYDFGEHEGIPFIVMELMKGQTLAERLARGAQTVGEVVDIGIQVAEALAAAHDRGIIHRDIKPANIFITDSGLAKVLDFGLAKLLPSQDSRFDTTNAPTSDQLTAVGSAVGTVAFMSPEQASGETLDGRTDLFSMGVVLYNCATGQPPFSGKTAAVVLAAILNRAHVAPTALNPDIPPRLQTVIDNCLEKDRALRYQAARDLVTDLRRVKRDLDVQNLEATGSLDGAHFSGSMRSAAAIPAPSRPAGAKTRAGWIGAGALAVAAVVGLALYLGNRTPSDDANPIDAVAEPAASEPAPIDLASRNLAAGNYRQALVYAEQVLETEPDDALATQIRDTTRLQVERFDDAILLARQSIASGDATRARDALDVARSVEPRAPEVAELSTMIVSLLERQVANAREAVRQTAAALPPVPPAPIEATPEAPNAGPDRVDETAAGPAPPLAELDSVAAITPPPPTATAPPEAPTVIAAAPVVVADAPAATPTPTNASPAPEVSPVAETGPQGPTAEEDRAAIEAVVASYGRAIELKSLELFREVKPNLSNSERDRLVDAFDAVESQQVGLTIVSLTVLGDTATVRVDRNDVIEAAGARQSTNSQQTFELTRSARGWVIESIGQ